MSRNSNQIARGRIRRFESYMPSHAVVSTNANVSALRGLSASSFAVLRQGKVRRGNSCLDVGIARCDGERRAQMEDDTLQEEGSRPHSFFLLRFGDPTL